MDFPAVERYLSHVSVRRPSAESSLADSPDSDLSHDDQLAMAEKAITRHTTRASLPPLAHRTTTNATMDIAHEVDFEPGDPQDPRNWPMWYKSFIIFSISYNTLVVVLYSTSYTTGIGQMQKEFNVSEPIVTLGVTTYLLGLAVGSLFLAPISETYGRKPVYAIAVFVFVLLVIPSAKVTSISSLIVLRFFSAIAGSAMIANSPGTVGDIISDDYRALAFSIWSLGPMNGPVIGPVVGGFVTQYKGWRWSNWVVAMAGAAGWVLMLITKETYAPALLQQKAKKMRKETGNDRFWSRYDTRLPFVKLMKANLSRPLSMAINEPICIFWNIYIALIYGVLYLCFVAYPIVYTETRGWSIGISGLAFVGIGVGAVIVIAASPLIRMMINAHKKDESGRLPPESMMSIVCIGAVLIPVGELWFAWTCLPVSIHPAAAIAAGIPFGAGNTIVFIYASNYLVHSYGIYAASAMAGNSVIRSFLGGTLPLAGPAMYRSLGANWAGTLLGGLELLLIPIPVIFYRYGRKIREKSALISEMREIEERQERKKQRAQQKLAEANATGDPEKVNEARLHLSRVNTGISFVRDVEKEAQAELSRVEGMETENQV